METSDHPSEEITRLLSRLGESDGGVSAKALARVYAVLYELARGHMAREASGHTLQPTALVHEAYLRLAEADGATWKSRNHFYAMASKVMRSLLVDHARRKKAEKRGGDRVRVALEEETPVVAGADDVDLLDLHTALEDLDQVQPELVQVIELRFFGGLTVPQMAETLEVSGRTVERRLRIANAWLRRRIEGAA